MLSDEYGRFQPRNIELLLLIFCKYVQKRCQLSMKNVVDILMLHCAVNMSLLSPLLS